MKALDKAAANPYYLVNRRYTIATITFTIPDNQVNRVTDGLGYDPNGGLTRAQFFKNWTTAMVKQALVIKEKAASIDSATSTVANDISTNINIT